MKGCWNETRSFLKCENWLLTLLSDKEESLARCGGSQQVKVRFLEMESSLLCSFGSKICKGRELLVERGSFSSTDLM